MVVGVALVASFGFSPRATAAPPAVDSWVTVVNNNDLIPDTERSFHSYNQPSVNTAGLVVFRARSKGPEQPISGIFTRAFTGGAIQKIADRATTVPAPNNTHYPPDGPLAAFNEFPSIPRVATSTSAIATRGNSPPVWTYAVSDNETRVGTNGVYVYTPAAGLITGASLLGAVPEPAVPVIGVNYFPYFAVPDAPPATRFDVFPGSPTITDQQVIAFKGNYAEGVVGKTGVYFRDLKASGGLAPVQLVANVNMVIPNLPTGVTGVNFGSTAPPSAAGSTVVFAGYDNEETPTYGGIYRAPLTANPALTTLVSIGDPVPDVPGETFTKFGEALAYDGRYVAFWAAWGDEEKILWLDEPTEGNAALLEYYREFVGDNFPVSVPVHQGIFLHDTSTGVTRMIAQTGEGFDDFLFWNFSGRPPGVGGGDEEEGESDGELPRWRSTAFLAVSSALDSGVLVAFKARTGEIDPVEHAYIDPLDGLYLGDGTGFQTLVDNTMPGSALDPEAPEGSIISGMGIEREGFRGNYLAITATMTNATTSESLAGIYAASFADPVQHGVSMRTKHHKRQAVFVVKNTGNGADSYHLTKHARNVPSSPDNPNPLRLSLTYFLNGRNLTAAFRAGRVHVTLGPGETARLVARVRPIGQALDHKRRVRVTAVATCDSTPTIGARRNVMVMLPSRNP